MARSIPEDALRIIASFLPYDQRVEMNRALPFDYRFVRKIKSDEHNVQYKVKLVNGKIARFLAETDQTKRVKIVKQIILYMLHTKDSCLFRYPNLKNMLYTKCLEFIDRDNYRNLMIQNPRLVKSSIRASTELLHKLETTTFVFPKNVGHAEFVKIV